MITSSISKTPTISKAQTAVTNEQLIRLQQSDITEFESRSNFNVVLQQLKMKTLQTKTRLDNMSK